MTWGELADRYASQPRRPLPTGRTGGRSPVARWISVGIAAAAVAGLGACGRDQVETVSDLEPPDDMQLCEERYADGQIIDYSRDGDFAKACVDENGELATPVPARLSCTDGRHLVFNDYAWGYENEEMTRFRAGDQERLPPEDAALDCLMEPAAEG